MIENGFYYDDFAYEAPVHARGSGGDREAHDGAHRQGRAVVRRVLPRDEAVAYFKGLGEHYKAGSSPASRATRT